MGDSASDSDHDDGDYRTKWTKEKVEELLVARRGYQAATFMSSGIAPDLDFQRHLDEITKMVAGRKRQKAKQKNEQSPMTRTRKTTIESPDGVICKEETVQIDHGAIRYATAINIRTGVNHCIPVKEDTGTEVNWITRGLAQSLALHILEAPAGNRFKDFHGNEFEATHRVTLPLVGEMDKSQHTECFITPDGFPFDCVVVGSAFVNEVGPPHEVFAEKPKGTALIMVQTPITVRSSLKTESVYRPNIKQEAEKLRIAAGEASAEAKAAALAREREQRMNAKSGLKTQVQSPQSASSASLASGPSSISSSRRGHRDTQGSELGL